MKSTITLLSIFIQFATLTTAFKTADLCPEKAPRTDRFNWHPNNRQMRDLMRRAVTSNENRLMSEENYYDNENRPNVTERIHVGNKTPVLGSMDMVTDPGHDAGLLSTIYEAYGNKLLYLLFQDAVSHA